MTRLEHAIVCPPLDGAPTGGTLYNARLLGALRERGIAADAVSVADAGEAVKDARARCFWVDSLHLSALPDLRARAAADTRVGLLAHYLPSLVALGRPPARDELSVEEKDALDAAERVLVTSDFMRDALAIAGVPESRLVTVMPGVDDAAEPSSESDATGVDHPRGALAALMVANLLPGKGVAPFLRALDGALADDVRLSLSVVGDTTLDMDYARECEAIVGGSRRLRRHVRFEGPLPHQAVLERLRASHVLVSASRMESFGMALAEARAAGVPILARAGGNVSALVDPLAGGELWDFDAPLARALVRLAQHRDTLATRIERARRNRITRRWDDAASDFVAQVGALASCGRGER